MQFSHYMQYVLLPLESEQEDSDASDNKFAEQTYQHYRRDRLHLYYDIDFRTHHFPRIPRHRRIRGPDVRTGQVLLELFTGSKSSTVDRFLQVSRHDGCTGIELSSSGPRWS